MLTRVSRPDGREITFTYDALGRRVGRKTPDDEARWVWDGDVILHELRSDRAMATWYHEPSSFAPLAKAVGDCVYHVIGDHLGAPTALYDEAGRLVWQLRLDIFGAASDAGPPRVPDADCPMRWPGQYVEDSIDLHYNRFRHYSPTLGRYVSADPLGVGSGLAAYAYPDDPLVSIDPLGLAACVLGPDATPAASRSAHAPASWRAGPRGVSIPARRLLGEDAPMRGMRAEGRMLAPDGLDAAAAGVLFRGRRTI
jgi:RHS repeat-associated protein